MAVWRTERKVINSQGAQQVQKRTKPAETVAKLLSLCKLSLCDRVLHAENENERFVRLSQ